VKTLGPTFKLTRTKDNYPASILNLSHKLLDQKEAEVLALGQKFIIKPKEIPENTILNAYEDFRRRIKLTYFFKVNKSKKEPPPNRFRIRSGWIPPEHKIHPFILKTLQQLAQDLDLLKPRNHLSRKDRHYHKMISNLKADESIIIKPADKGSSMIIMEKQDYIEEGNRQLKDDLH
jgi:hypothetical protein